MKLAKIFRAVLWVQAVYYLVTALWGLLHIESFMVVTGPKIDVWLVKTVSALIIPIAVCLFCGLFLPTHPLLLILVGATSAIAFAAIDFYYTANRVIRWVYAVDGVVQSVILLVWLLLLARWKQLLPGAANPPSTGNKEPGPQSDR